MPPGSRSPSWPAAWASCSRTRTTSCTPPRWPKKLGSAPATSASRPTAGPPSRSGALQVTGLTGEANSHPRHLSFGERKRVAFASVLAMGHPDHRPGPAHHRPGPPLRRPARRAHRRPARAGKTILAITHDTDFCAENFDRVVVLSEGRVRWDGPVERWLEGDRNPSMSAFEQPPRPGSADDSAGRPPWPRSTAFWTS